MLPINLFEYFMAPNHTYVSHLGGMGPFLTLKYDKILNEQNQNKKLFLLAGAVYQFVSKDKYQTCCRLNLIYFSSYKFS